MSTGIAKIYEPKESKLRIKKWLTWIGIFFGIAMFCIIGQHIVDNTIGQFPDIYDAIDFNNDFEREDIISIVYGDTTAMAIYRTTAGQGMECFCQRDGLWVYSGLKDQDYGFDSGLLTVMKTDKGDDWCARVLIYTQESKAESDMIHDEYGTEFYQYASNKLVRAYFAYIHPRSKDYEISVNGVKYQVVLKHYS